MTRMGLWNFTCLLPAEASLDHGHHNWREEEMEQPGTSYSGKEFSYTDTRKVKGGSSGVGEFEAARGTGSRDRVNCSGGSANMLACFRAGAINLIVHPAMVTMGGQRQGASAVQPVNSLPRAAFLDGAADHDSGDDPTSPVVTCIGQVKKDKPKTPPKNVEIGDLRSLKSRRETSSSPSSPKPSKWRQILGARGTVNPSLQTRSESECHVDLSRFSSACSSIAKSAPTLKDIKTGRTQTGTFLAKSLMMLQLECEAREASEARDMGASEAKTTTSQGSEDGAAAAALSPPVGIVPRGASEEVLLWKRRSGGKPLTLDLKRRT